MEMSRNPSVDMLSSVPLGCVCLHGIEFLGNSKKCIHNSG